MAVEIENLCKSFGDKKVLHNLNMRLEDGGIYCLMGPSGMGKTTLLRIIMNLETKDSGNIIGIDPKTEISAMFQEDRILPYLSAAENVNMMYEKKRPLKEIKQDLELILPKKCLNQPVCELSGGMKRRVSLARTMHFQGKMIILDEPFTGLDTETRQKVIQYILRNRGNRILLVATHGENDATLLGAEIIRLEKCQDLPVLHGREHEKKEIQREKIQQVEELLKSLKQINDSVSDMEQQRSTTLSAISDISSVSAETAAGSSNVQSAAEGQLKAIQDLDKATSALAARSEELTTLLSGFRV